MNTLENISRPAAGLSHVIKRISSYPLLFFTYLSKIINF